MPETDYIPAYLISVVSAEALAPEVTRASAELVLTIQDWKHVGLLHCESDLLLLSKIQDMIQSVNKTF